MFVMIFKEYVENVMWWHINLQYSLSTLNAKPEIDIIGYIALEDFFH